MKTTHFSVTLPRPEAGGALRAGRLLGLALLLGLGLLLSPAARAQPGSGGPGPGAGPTSTPLDGGASLLLAGGMAYALRRLRQRRA